MRELVKNILNFMINLITHPKNIRIILLSIRSFCTEIVSYKYGLSSFKKRKNGISVLLPTQNEEKMVKLSVLSFLDFADEIIIVDNGSIDRTISIIKDLVKKYPKIKFFHKPELPDLYQNRQFALRQSKYRWICRFDSDYVAYTDGFNNILQLRKILLTIPRGIIPKVISLYKVNIDRDFWHTRINRLVLTGRRKIIGGPEPRIYEFFPFFTFTRIGRREYGAFQNLMKNTVLRKVYFMHCTIKSNFNLFFRSERTNWRELGNFRKYPTLLSYIKDVIVKKYNTANLKVAIQKFSELKINDSNQYIEYNPDSYLPYPKLVKIEMEKRGHLYHQK